MATLKMLKTSDIPMSNLLKSSKLMLTYFREQFIVIIFYLESAQKL